MKTAPVETIASNDNPALEIVGLTFRYPDAARDALSGVSFSVARGRMIGVMGASGAGKSTLAKCLNRIIPEFEGGDYAGDVRLDGQSLGAARVSEVAGKIGMVFQDFEAQLFSTNAAHEVAFAMEQEGMSRIEMNARIGPALAAVGLAGFEHRDPTSLSGGEKQRLAIASVLALRPDVIVLDEPTTDLDPEGKSEVFALIDRLRDQGLTLIVVEHETEELRGADRVIILRGGEIAAIGTPSEIMLDFTLLESCGVRPPGLNRVLRMLGIEAHAESVDDAYAKIIERYPRASRQLESVAKADTPSIAPPTSNATPIADLRAVSFSYPDGPRILDSIDLRIDAGDFVAIVGPNGSGKTTLAKQIVGLLKPEGTIELDGRDRASMSPAESAHLAAYVFQNPDHQIFAATVEDEVCFGPRNFGLSEGEIRARCDEVLGAVGLEHSREADPFLLSKGERQRLAVASVLALKPRLLILDEPTTGLDHREQLRMMELVSRLNQSGIAIVIITHTPWLVAEYARRVVMMRKGRVIFDGDVRDFFSADDLMRSASFRPPDVALLARRFAAAALTPAELAQSIRELAQGRD